VILYPEGIGVTLRYYERVDDQIFIDQTIDELGDEEGEFESEVSRREPIVGVNVVIWERRLTDDWVELSISWQAGGVSYRLAYHRSEAAVPDEDLIAELEAGEFDTSSVNVESRPAEIDEAMRAESREVVSSIIKQR
jgi:hypothetical protein